jgi:hypothetical protein
LDAWIGFDPDTRTFTYTDAEVGFYDMVVIATDQESGSELSSSSFQLEVKYINHVPSWDTTLGDLVV